MPHRWRQFKLSNDPACVETLTDIVGLSVASPAHAVVLSIDDTSHSQALDRTQPGLPLKKGRGATMTYDDKRNGTTTLFAALTVLDGTVRAARQSASPPGVPEIPQPHRAHDTRRRPGPCHPRQRRYSQAQGSPGLARTPSALDRPRHPTSSAWLNALEGVFAKLTRRRLKDGVCRSGRDLQDAIRRVIDEHNTTEAKSFVWTADPDTIIAAGKRGV